MVQIDILSSVNNCHAVCLYFCWIGTLDLYQLVCHCDQGVVEVELSADYYVCFCLICALDNLRPSPAALLPCCPASLPGYITPFSFCRFSSSECVIYGLTRWIIDHLHFLLHYIHQSWVSSSSFPPASKLASTAHISHHFSTQQSSECCCARRSTSLSFGLSTCGTSAHGQVRTKSNLK